MASKYSSRSSDEYLQRNKKFSQKEFNEENKQYFQSIQGKPQLFLDVTRQSKNCCYLCPKNAVVLWIFEQYELYMWVDLNLTVCGTSTCQNIDGSEIILSESCIKYESEIIFAKAKLPSFEGRKSKITDDTSVNYEINCTEQDLCSRPYVYLCEKQLTICGLTSVIRFLIKFVSSKMEMCLSTANEEADNFREKYERLHDLLGFRGACLQACAENSIWTNFCEVDIFKATIQAIKKLDNDIVNCSSLPRTSLAILEETIPPDLLRFEYHLRTPVRIHNIRKIVQLKQNNIKLEGKLQANNNLKKEIPQLDHEFAEGPYIRLCDLILFPCVHLFILIYGEEMFEQYLPKTLIWFKKLDTLFNLSDCKKLQLSHINKPYDTNWWRGALQSQTSWIVPEVPEESLYKTDHTRYNPTLRLFTRQNDVQDALAAFLSSGIPVFEIEEVTSNVNWAEIPVLAQPEGGRLPEKRQEKKSQQLSCMAAEVLKVVKEKVKHSNNSSPSLRIVDFCSGGGHVGILLAWLLPKCQIILVENKEESLRRGMERVEQLGLTNVAMYQCNLDYFDGSFDIGVCLHACGSSTDLVLSKCIASNASFVCCPCCYGGIQSNLKLHYPRSSIFQERNISSRHYFTLAHTSDQTHNEKNEKTKQGKLCMQLIDTDRCFNAQQNGYKVYLTKMVPDTATVKNHIIVGISKPLNKPNA